MKIGVTQIILGKMTVDETLELCREAGYETVELVFGEGRDPDVNMSAAEVKAVGAKCRAAGVEIGSVIAWYAERGSLLSRNRADHEKGRRCLARALEIAGLLGVNGILLHPGQLTAEGTYDQAWDDLRGILKEMAPTAASNRAAIGLENVWNKFLLSPREMREFLEQVGSEWVGAYLDTANMMEYGYPEHWVRGLGRWIKKVHFKDYKRRERAQPWVHLMDGDTDWATLMKEFRVVGYDDCVIHEVGGDREVQIEMARRMKKIVAM